jgi:hypothetical protein
VRTDDVDVMLCAEGVVPRESTTRRSVRMTGGVPGPAMGRRSSCCSLAARSPDSSLSAVASTSALGGVLGPWAEGGLDAAAARKECGVKEEEEVELISTQAAQISKLDRFFESEFTSTEEKPAARGFVQEEIAEGTEQTLPKPYPWP